MVCLREKGSTRTALNEDRKTIDRDTDPVQNGGCEEWRSRGGKGVRSPVDAL